MLAIGVAISCVIVALCLLSLLPMPSAIIEDMKKGDGNQDGTSKPVKVEFPKFYDIPKRYVIKVKSRKRNWKGYVHSSYEVMRSEEFAQRFSSREEAEKRASELEGVWITKVITAQEMMENSWEERIVRHAEQNPGLTEKEATKFLTGLLEEDAW